MKNQKKRSNNFFRKDVSKPTEDNENKRDKKLKKNIIR